MRKISTEQVTEAVAKLCMDANYYIPEDVRRRIEEMRDAEESPVGKEILRQILENQEIAAEEKMPLCQDTGFTVVYAEIGQEVHFDGDIKEAISKGVAKGYTDGYLRKSILIDPLKRSPNSGDNTPPVIWFDLVPGDKVKITIAPKGGGSENMSRTKMLRPSDGVEGFKNFVVQSVVEAGGNPCPPVIVGVGVGGTFDKCAFLAKKALLRNIGERNKDPFYAEIEEELLERINKSGVGPMGLGGRTTALEVFIEQYPLHIATFPAAVNLNCHAARHKEIVI
ncbi:fumarate hydratase [bacterium]|nr:fumarate hydratase [bacterium]RKZ26118.1 MAG: fumarate hydratase [bacterium]